jgi:NADH:ubiquinone oxidoreductase subunit 5 (subunit L)/multisubunit Na+/H+ antiporter MnhA subunit
MGYYDLSVKLRLFYVPVDGKNIDLITHLMFFNNHLYVFKQLFLNQSDTINFISSFFTNMYSSNVDYSFFFSKIHFDWIVYGDEDIADYYLELGETLSQLKKDARSIFTIEGIYNFFYNNNTPLFIYFGCFFILSTIISLVLMSYLGLYGVFVLNLITIVLFWLSCIFYIDSFFLLNYSYKVNFGKWFTVLLSYNVYFELFIDSISYSFMLLTITIATFVYIYLFSYFRYESNVERLILFINAFVISMIILVTSGNFFVMFLGWEMIGLTSFLLINFWSTRISTLKSAFKAYAFNKFSDVCILIAVLLSLVVVTDVSIPVFINQISLYNDYYINILNYDVSVIEAISFFFIAAAFVKSAQFGAHIWLPDSMEAPVPASALIHSATLVSAGVFLLLRLSPLFELSTYAYYVIPLVGSFTAFFGGLCAAYQSDIKRILAYSTISHCGFLMVCYSTHVAEYTILYLYIHGFFKASVFLCAGNIIRFSRNYQDFRRMGGYWKYLPFECFASFVCLINLCGLPFTIGFYIKHLILIGVGFDYTMLNFILINILGGALFGIIYSYKFFYFVFFDIRKAKKPIYIHANRDTFRSKYYSNTSLAANTTIASLIIVSYVVSLYLLNMFLNHTSIGEGLDIYSLNSSAYLEFNIPTKALLNNIGYFNWLLLVVIVVVCVSTWRNVFKGVVLLKFFNFIIIFSIFFYTFYGILV